MTLGPHDHVVGAWADAPCGPGWSNRLVWVCVRSALDGAHRVDALQPEEQSEEILAMFPFTLVASGQLLGAVTRLAERLAKSAQRKNATSARGSRRGRDGG